MNKTLVTSLLGAIAMGAVFAAPAYAETGACLITKNNTNPFFVKMKEGATKAATDAGIKLTAAAGVKDGDAAPQITAIENCIASGAKGILITASNDSVIPALKKARAAGVLVIALDTPIGDKDAADMTFATDNFEAGILIGKWAKATLGDKAKDAKIGMLDINKDNISVDVARDTGFLVGFGIDVPNKKVMGSEKDARVIGHQSSDANPEGGVKSVASGVIGATSQQYPLLMASKGIEAIAAFAKDGTKPKASDGLDFFNTGVNLITDKPAAGVPSIDSKEGTAKCWG